jgi:hypothetical protein
MIFEKHMAVYATGIAIKRIIFMDDRLAGAIRLP